MSCFWGCCRDSYAATWHVNANAYHNLLQKHAVPASISQSACNSHARQGPHHTAKQLKQFLEAKNFEIMAES